jgi:predicted tellurium resistance membrane protein TerC
MLEAIISLITLVVMEVALGIDNIIFVSILASKLPSEQQPRARQVWMIAGIIMRVALLASLILLLKRLEKPLIEFDLSTYHLHFSGKDLIMLAGGMFLIFKSVKEIHEKLEGEETTESSSLKNSFRDVVLQIIVIDLIFSIDSIITAIGIVDGSPDKNPILIMSAAVILAMFGMFIFAKPLGDLVNRHPTLKMLALCFLLLIGVLLVAEGFSQHISKGYIYFAMAFSILVEILNIYSHKKHEEPIRLRMPHLKDEEVSAAETWKD